METTTLPSADEIVRRLTSVNDDETTRAIYADIARFENRQLTAGGIMLMLSQAISDHVPGGELAAMIRSFIPAWIDLLVENEAVAREAKELHEKVLGAARTVQEEVSLAPPITNQRQASAYLRHWIRQQGYTGSVRILQAYGQRTDRTGTYFDFDVLEPQGVFAVYEDGRVEDNYQVFIKKDKSS